MPSPNILPPTGFEHDSSISFPTTITITLSVSQQIRLMLTIGPNLTVAKSLDIRRA